MFESVFVTKDGYLKFSINSLESGLVETINAHDYLDYGHPYNLNVLSNRDCFFEDHFLMDNFGDNIMALLRVAARRKLGQETKEEMETSFRFIEATFNDDEAPLSAKICVRRLMDHLYLSIEEMLHWDSLLNKAGLKGLFKRVTQKATRH